MDQDIEYFLRKHHITFDLVDYIIKEPDRCALHLRDGKTIYYYHSLHSLIEALPEGDFIHINRGAVVSASRIMKVSGREYLMADGMVLKGRSQDKSLHRRNHLLAQEAAEMRKRIGYIRLTADFSAFDDLPAPVFILQTERDEEGCMDYIFRYCNNAFANTQYITAHALTGRSLFDVFMFGDQRWLQCFVRVAKTGKAEDIRNFCPWQGKAYTCRCYQPIPGYCGCLLI